MPGYKEFMEMFKFKSKNSVYKLINNMVDEGMVEKDSGGHLIPQNIFGGVAMLGLVEAGIPHEAIADINDAISLDDFLIRKPGETYMLTVKGESMIDAGIHDGDRILIEQASVAKQGDIVVAEVDGDWTLKYYESKRGQPYLKPANKNFDSIFPREYLRVGGIVKAVIRKYA